jgi:hypothetical protein
VKKENKKIIEKDKCVSCGKETRYSKDLHLDLRNYYIEGVGQLCYDCYTKLYR